MKENIDMWAYTRMIVLFALSTALYAVFLWIFAQLPALQIVPGFTSVRPANAFPIVTSLLFGPASSWGAAFGNLIGYDIMGGYLTIGSIGGFIGNFFFGLLPYYTYHKFFKEEPHCKTLTSLAKFEVTVFLASSACGMIIATWLELTGILPFAYFSVVVTFNNAIAGWILGPILMALFYDRVEKLGLRWTDIMPGFKFIAEERGFRVTVGYILLWIGFVVGNFLTMGVAFGVTDAPFKETLTGYFINPIAATSLIFIIIGLVGLVFMELGRTRVE
ncbi:MAG: QueT transporter family protein [Candidatus Korarchaeota archaeon]|nr:QueT transporter family protein [Candidatus Korarchaeota archaeon]NIU84925.1 QueT transporter family protein [Candidatus Thorarchaeota archaeon]NIW14942.1 QueT transporter family protein [Candidatus Thorarchaeota archaeon]NIW52909.1 QueT transporter family protein [Candidatus Korarchaeota archaeon]